MSLVNRIRTWANRKQPKQSTWFPTHQMHVECSTCGVIEIGHGLDIDKHNNHNRTISFLPLEVRLSLQQDAEWRKRTKNGTELTGTE